MNDVIESPKSVSGYRIEQALATWQATRTRLLSEDADLAHDEAALSALLGPEEGDIEEVLSRLLRGARHAKAMADASAALIEDQRARHDRYKRRNETMRATAFAIMDAIGKTKIELPDLTASIRAGQPSVIISDEEKIPDIYIRTERKPDRATILSVLKSGQTVEGCQLSNALPTLSLKVK